MNEIVKPFLSTNEIVKPVLSTNEIVKPVLSTNEIVKPVLSISTDDHTPSRNKPLMSGVYKASLSSTKSLSGKLLLSFGVPASCP